MAVQDDTVAEGFKQTIPEPLAQLPQAFACRWQRLTGYLAGRPKGDHVRDIFRAGSSALFMARPVNERLQLYAAPDTECPHTLWRLKPVPGYAEQIHPKLIHVHGILPGPLGGIRMHQD